MGKIEITINIKYSNKEFVKNQCHISSIYDYICTCINQG